MTSKPICLIIGAGDYIGAAIARRFAKGGFHIVMGRRRGEKLAPVTSKIETAGGSAQGFNWDARKEETAIEMFAHIENKIGPRDLHLQCRWQCVLSYSGDKRACVSQGLGDVRIRSVSVGTRSR